MIAHGWIHSMYTESEDTWSRQRCRETQRSDNQETLQIRLLSQQSRRYDTIDSHGERKEVLFFDIQMQCSPCKVLGSSNVRTSGSRVIAKSYYCSQWWAIFIDAIQQHYLYIKVYSIILHIIDGWRIVIRIINTGPTEESIRENRQQAIVWTLQTLSLMQRKSITNCRTTSNANFCTNKRDYLTTTHRPGRAIETTICAFSYEVSDMNEVEKSMYESIGYWAGERSTATSVEYSTVHRERHAPVSCLHWRA